MLTYAYRHAARVGYGCAAALLHAQAHRRCRRGRRNGRGAPGLQVCGLKLLVYEALSFLVLVYAALSDEMVEVYEALSY